VRRLAAAFTVSTRHSNTPTATIFAVAFPEHRHSPECLLGLSCLSSRPKWPGFFLRAVSSAPGHAAEGPVAKSSPPPAFCGVRRLAAAFTIKTRSQKQNAIGQPGLHSPAPDSFLTSLPFSFIMPPICWGSPARSRFSPPALRPIARFPRVSARWSERLRAKGSFNE
jgi:hypothetical protein